MVTSLYAPDVKVEVAFNAGVRTPKASRTWTDVSDYVELDAGIGITGGRGDERSTAEANGLSLEVDNSDGRFTPDLASSPYYPNVRIGRPIRVTATYPTQSGANLLSAANANFESGVGGWTGTGTVAPSLAVDAVTKKYGSQSLKITWNGGGSLPQAQVSTAGLTASVVYTWAVWVYVPAGAPDVRLIASTSTGALSAVKDQWHRLSLTFTQGASTTVTVGIRSAGTPSSTVCYADGGMLVYGSDVGDFNTLTPTTYTRFEGYVDEWPTDWSADVDSLARSRLVALSRLARLGASTKLRSVIEQETLDLAPVLYYPLGEPTGSTTAADVSGNGGDPLKVAGAGGTFTFGSATGVGTDGLTALQLSGGRHLKDTLVATSSTGVTVSLFLRCTDFTSTSVGSLLAAYGLNLAVGSGGGLVASVGGIAAVGAGFGDNETHHLVARVTAAGTITAWVDGVQVATQAGAGTPSGTSILVGENNGVTQPPFTVSHVAVWDRDLTSGEIAALTEAGLTAFDQEPAVDRLARFAGYAGLAAADYDIDAAAVLPIAHVNPSGQTQLEPMRTVETTEGGVLFDARDNTLTYLGRAARYTAAAAVTLSMDAAEVEAGVAPRYDRTTLLNDVTATTVDGAAHRSVDAGSVDDYGPAETSVDLASTDPIEATAAADWRVTTYAQPRTRIPNLTVELINLDPAQVAALLACDVGSLIVVDDWPTQAASATQSFFVEGYADQVALESYSITFNVSPAEPWLDTFVLEDAVRGELDDVYRIAY